MEQTTKDPKPGESRTASELQETPSLDTSLDKLKLLEFSINEEHYFIDAHQKRINFYASLISAILAATIGGAMRATRRVDFLLLCVGPILVSFLSWIAKKACLRFYQRFLEAVTIRAKLEESLGLAKQFTDKNAIYWQGEPLIPTRHINDREKAGTSVSFVKERVKSGDPSGPAKLFTAFLIVGVALLIAFGLIAYFGIPPIG